MTLAEMPRGKATPLGPHRAFSRPSGADASQLVFARSRNAARGKSLLKDSGHILLAVWKHPDRFLEAHRRDRFVPGGAGPGAIEPSGGGDRNNGKTTLPAPFDRPLEPAPANHWYRRNSPS